MLLGVATWFLLADGPWSARWLSSEEKDQVARDRQGEDLPQEDGKQTVHVIRDCIIYFLWSSGNYGLTFWLPKILSAWRLYNRHRAGGEP